MLKKLVIQSVCTTLLLGSFVSNAAVVNTISFDEVGVHTPSENENYGTIIDDEYEAANYDGDINVTFWADKAFDINNTTSNNDLFLTVFNTKADFATQDPDLLVSDTNIGNVAVIHERNGDCSVVTNQCLDPDDRYESSSSTHGGYVFAQFSEEVILESIDLVDIESGTNQQGEIGFFDENQQLIGDWISMDVTNNGNNGGSTTQLFPSSGAFTYLVVHMIGSGGFTNLSFSSASDPATVPEPSTLAILALGLFGLVSRKFQK